jgi:hypothetical protein
MLRVVVTFLVVLGSTCGVCAALEAFNVDLRCGWDGYYRPMEWTPTEIGISTTLTEPFGGSLTLTAQQDDLNTLNIVHNIVLTPGRSLPLPLVTKLAFLVHRCTLTIRDSRGRTRWEQTWSAQDYSDAKPLLRVVREEDLLVGVAGRPQFGLLQLPEDARCMSPRGPGNVHIGTKPPQMMPWDWTGFASLDMLILYDLDWTLLNLQQSKAVCDWVLNGGTLLLVLGRHPLPPHGDLSRLIPLTVGDLRTCEIPSAVLDEWGLDASQLQSVTAWSLSAKPGAFFWQKTETPEAGCLFGAAYVGFGRVAVLGFDPSELGERQARQRASFWTRQISTCLSGQPAELPGVERSSRNASASASGCKRAIVLKEQVPGIDGRRNVNANFYGIGVAQGAANRILDHLYRIPQMRPLSIWWVILTLSALAILLGPVDYLVLRRLDKLPYTWLTATGWIGLFTVGAFYGVQHLRGNTMYVRAVSVLDSVTDSNCTWATCYVGLFAPRSDEYRLDGLRNDQWWAGISPTLGEVVGSRRQAGTRQLRCLQEDGANLPLSVPISIWTMQSLLGECPLDRAPFTAEVKISRDPNTATVEITNASGSRIIKGFVLWAHGYASFGEVPAHATQTNDLPWRPFDPWGEGDRPDRYLDESPEAWYRVPVPRYPNVLGGQAASAFLAQGCLNRSLTMHGCLRLGAALVCVEFENAPMPFAVRGRSYRTNHIQYARQLVPIGG